MSALVLCPWCNSEDVIPTSGYAWTCVDCGARGPRNDPGGTKWNTRPLEREIIELRKQLLERAMPLSQVHSSNYPNLEAIVYGTISGAFREWPKIRPEAEAALVELAALRERVRVLEATLLDFAKFGVRADLHPSMAHPWDTNDWYEYLNRIDTSVRDRAKHTLETKGLANEVSNG